MKITDRRIEIYPFQRTSAERIIRYAKDSVEVQTEFLEYTNSLQVTGSHSGFMQYEEMNIADFMLRTETLIAGTFPELLPIEWGVEL